MDTTPLDSKIEQLVSASRALTMNDLMYCFPADTLLAKQALDQIALVANALRQMGVFVDISDDAVIIGDPDIERNESPDTPPFLMFNIMIEFQSPDKQRRVCFNDYGMDGCNIPLPVIGVSYYDKSKGEYNIAHSIIVGENDVLQEAIRFADLANLPGFKDVAKAALVHLFMFLLLCTRAAIVSN